MIKIHGLGYSRDCRGKVSSRHIKDIANTITASTGGGGNADYFILEVYESE